MIGAIIGDMVGAPYEFNSNNYTAKDFPLWNAKSQFTDDTIMTCAIATACIHFNNDDEDFRKMIIKEMHRLGNEYREGGYGGRFMLWLMTKPNADYSNLEPYGSFGNGSAMRVSPVAWRFNTLEDVLKYAKITAEVTHNHEEGIKSAQAVAAAIFLARTGKTKREIKEYIEKTFGYDLNKTCDEIRPTYRMDETCQGSVPQAIRAFIEGVTYEDCIRTAVSIGGDSDTIACITGSMAEGYYHIPTEIRNEAMKRLEHGADLVEITKIFTMMFVN